MGGMLLIRTEKKATAMTQLEKTSVEMSRRPREPHKISGIDLPKLNATPLPMPMPTSFSSISSTSLSHKEERFRTRT